MGELVALDLPAGPGFVADLRAAVDRAVAFGLPAGSIIVDPGFGFGKTAAQNIELLAGLDASHPGFAERLHDDTGGLRRFVNIFVADEDIRFLDGIDTPVAAGQVVSIVPAVAGG